MKSKSYFYSLIPLFLLIISVVLVSCGGSDSTGVIPGNISQAPSVQLVSKEVSGYIFATNGLTSSQAGEEVSQRFVILDVPLSGEDAFFKSGVFHLTGGASGRIGVIRKCRSYLISSLQNCQAGSLFRRLMGLSSLLSIRTAGVKIL